tara:strand:+ start:516 stop:1061 length:546 start_codon:yes stop_codon:yes gene_type:complete
VRTDNHPKEKSIRIQNSKRATVGNDGEARTTMGSDRHSRETCLGKRQARETSPGERKASGGKWADIPGYDWTPDWRAADVPLHVVTLTNHRMGSSDERGGEEARRDEGIDAMDESEESSNHRLMGAVVQLEYHEQFNKHTTRFLVQYHSICLSLEYEVRGLFKPDINIKTNEFHLSSTSIS